MSENRWKWLVFSLIVLLVFGVYFHTTAPSVVFWDVGEFLAAAHILGVPHPPGTPLYVFLCKFMDLLPLPTAALYKLINGVPALDSVLRMTLIPIATGAFTAGLVYLITYDIINHWKPNTPKHLVHLSAATGALLAAFGAVNWMNSIEAETYAPANFFALLSVYLALVWYRRRKTDQHALRFLVAGLYLLVLSTGIHLTAIFTLPALFFFVAIVEPKLIFGKEFFGLLGLLGLSAGLMKQTYEPTTGGAIFITVSLALVAWFFHKAGFFKALSNFWTLLFIIGGAGTLWGAFGHNNFALVAGIVAVFLASYLRAKLWKDWRGLVLIVMILAFTPEFWLIVRANYLHYHPNVARINEADPYTWRAFMDVLSRKQYEPAKMLPRRINWIDQIRVFWLYLNWQYVIVIPLVFMSLVGVITHFFNELKTKVSNTVIIILAVLGAAIGYFMAQGSGGMGPVVGALTGAAVLAGITYLYYMSRDVLKRGSPASFLLVGSVLILATAGFWFAFNLKDSPTMPVNPLNAQQGLTEVRDRDYFYATAHIMISLFAGIGLWEIIRLFGNYLSKAIKSRNMVWLLVSVVAYPVAGGLVIYQFTKFYPECNRSRFYLAEDSAFNILASPSTGGVLFTNGDNDTFPVWFDQEVLGIRRDVIVANLSLLNTNWYIRQLKAWGAPISFSYEDIDRFPPITPSMDQRKRFLYIREIMIKDMIATSVGYKPKKFVSIKDINGNPLQVPEIYLGDPVSFMREVFDGKSFSTNIYFSMTTTPEAWEGWEDHLLMEGNAFRLLPNAIPGGAKYPLENVNTEYTARLLHDAMAPVEYLQKYTDYNLEQPTDVFRYRGVLDPKVRKYDRYDTNEKIIRNYAQIAFSLGSYYAKQGHMEKAAQELEMGKMFLDQIPQDKVPGILKQQLYISLSLAEMYTQLGQLDKAEQHLERAAEIQPGPQVDMRRAEILRAKGELDEAEKYYQRVLDANVNDPVGIGVIASFYEQRGNYAKAESLYKRSIRGGWRDTSVINGLERVLRAQGKQKEADSLKQSLGNPNFGIGTMTKQGGN